MKESVHMETDIPSEDHDKFDNVPIEIKEHDTHTTQESPSVSQNMGKGKEVANQYDRRVECWKYFTEIKENGKRVAGKCKYYNVIYKADSTENGTKNLKNHFPKCSKNPENQSKLKQA